MALLTPGEADIVRFYEQAAADLGLPAMKL